MAFASNKIIIFSDGESAIECHRFFAKYGFETAFFVFDKKKDEKFLGAPVFPFDRIDDEKLVDLDCPIVIASSDPEFISVVKKRMDGLMIDGRLVFDEPLMYSAWLQELLDALSFNNKTKPNEYLSHLLDIHPANLNNGPSATKALADYVSRRIQKDIKPGQKTLGVYYPSAAYRMNLGSEAMYDKIRQQGYNVVFLFGVLCGDQFEKRNYSYYAGHDIVGSLDFIDVFVIPTVMLGLPEQAKKVLFVHDIYDSPLGAEQKPSVSENSDYPHESAFLDDLDYVFLPCTAVMRANIIHQFVRNKPLCRIPGGYIKLDSNIRYFQENKLPTDSIIYAPTVTEGNFAEYVSVPQYGEKIVEALLDGFEKYRIIFRPHPHTLETEAVQTIANRFAGHERFDFDSNASYYNDNYCRSAIMVTDMSGTAFTYAFMTLRPVVFFSHRENYVAEAFGNVSYFEDREQIGYIATTIDELRKAVALALRNSRRFARNTRIFRDRAVFNLGKAEDYFAENFHHIVEGTRHKDWQYVVAPISQAEARLLEPLHDCVEHCLGETNNLKETVKKQQTLIRKSERQIDDKIQEIEGLRSEAIDKKRSIAALKNSVELKTEENRKLTEVLDKRTGELQNLRLELEEIKSKWWFRLLSSTKKRLTRDRKADREG
ncbi:MAG: CDP-glycerol glycerophosphotransferase family protein [Sedimentisphaerales bacterium]|nr:CDP-glycerol glycerophosphotransferase family protein [Sedimentisphaerales bacterium]